VYNPSVVTQKFLDADLVSAARPPLGSTLVDVYRVVALHDRNSQ
jgi:hypothetical protein